MIYYVTGVLGAGKSYFGSKKIAEALLKGKMVSTNMRLVPGWEKIVLSHAPYYKLAKQGKKTDYEAHMRRRYAWIPDMEVLVSSKLHGKGESRGVRLIDEAHNEINNREWMDANQKKTLRKMALARKRGWDDYILAQSKDNTDNALRRIGGMEIRLVNWRKLLVMPVFQCELLPFNLFLALAFSMNTPGTVRRESKVVWRQLYRLGWEKDIYDTFEDFDAGSWDDDEDEEVLYLPLSEGREYVHSEYLKERAARPEEERPRIAELEQSLLLPTSEPKPWPPRSGLQREQEREQAQAPRQWPPRSSEALPGDQTPTDPPPVPTSGNEVPPL